MCVYVIPIYVCVYMYTLKFSKDDSLVYVKDEPLHCWYLMNTVEYINFYKTLATTGISHKQKTTFDTTHQTSTFSCKDSC